MVVRRASSASSRHYARVARIRADPERSLSSQLLEMVSHEIRNPLASIKIVVQTLIRSQHADERTKRRLAIANREIRSVERILTALVELGRHASAKQRIFASPASLVAEAIQLSEAELNRPDKIPCSVNVQPGLPLVSVDWERILFALTYLIFQITHSVYEGVLAIEVAEGDGVVRFDLKTANPSPVKPRIGKSSLCFATVRKIARDHGGDLVFGRLKKEKVCRFFLPAKSTPSVL